MRRSHGVTSKLIALELSSIINDDGRIVSGCVGVLVLSKCLDGIVKRRHAKTLCLTLSAEVKASFFM